MVGNAVSVNTAEWIGKKLRKPKFYDFREDTPLNELKTWPNAAWNVGAGRFSSSASTYPVNVNVGLNEFLRHEIKPLSTRALTGFLKRVDKGNLKFPPDFIKKLREQISEEVC